MIQMTRPLCAAQLRKFAQPTPPPGPAPQDRVEMTTGQKWQAAARHLGIGTVAGAAAGALTLGAMALVIPPVVSIPHAFQALVFGALSGGVCGAIAAPAAAAIHGLTEGQQGYHPQTAAIAGAVAGAVLPGGFILLLVNALRNLT